MKLYFFPGASSLAVHIVLREAGLPCEIERVDLANKMTAGGLDFMAINPKGFVPALVLDNGQILTEAQVIMQYVADRVPDRHLVPPSGSMARYRLMEWLAYIASDLQKGFAPLFNPDTTDAVRETVHANLARQFDYLEERLEQNDFLLGEHYSIADGYLFTVLNWAAYVGLDLGEWPALVDYLARVASRPAVQAAMQAEGLL